jgi:uncharacterized phiE125 gp8 family phage protein
MQFNGLVLTTAPAVEPVTTSEAKSHLRVDYADDDTLIGTLITAARQMVEAITRRALITQTWDLWLDAFPGEAHIEIPLPPLQSITSITYYDDADIATTFSSTNYYVDTKREPGRIVLRDTASWPSATLRGANGAAIRFIAGYGLAVAVPQQLKQATLLMVGHLYEHREAVSDERQLETLPLGFEYLLWPYRVLTF